tara:strand:- start:281 stop:1024 length:744 start_codon:yes stop_codon:yes gene_type:complete
MSKNILILQHLKSLTPGLILDLLKKDKFNLTIIQLDEGEEIPKKLSNFDAMLCMGGPMDTWMEDKFPWLKKEKIKIKEFVINLRKPYLGICLGCQLLGEILGGRVVKSNPAEIGILDIKMTKESNTDKIFAEFPKIIKALQWHSYEVHDLEKNENVKIIGSSLKTKYQIFKYMDHAYGIQFHTEIKNGAVYNLLKIPELKKSLEDNLGIAAIKKFDEDAQSNMKEMNKNAQTLYNNFKKLFTIQKNF